MSIFIQATKKDDGSFSVSVKNGAEDIGSFETADTELIEDIGCLGAREVFDEGDLVKFKSFEEIEKHCIDKASD